MKEKSLCRWNSILRTRQEEKILQRSVSMARHSFVFVEQLIQSTSVFVILSASRSTGKLFLILASRSFLRVLCFHLIACMLRLQLTYALFRNNKWTCLSTRSWMFREDFIHHRYLHSWWVLSYFLLTLSPIPAFTDAFETGTERTYSIINDVTLYDLKTADQPIGYRVSGGVKVGAIWGNNDDGFLLRFEVTSRSIRAL